MEQVIPFDWYRLWVAAETPASFLGEIGFRTAVMFIFLLLMLKLLSKRGVKQLSVFELAILIALGSAAGDPMFYHTIPLLHGMLVIILVIFIYRMVTHFSSKSAYLARLLEGKPVCLLEKGQINFAQYSRVRLPLDKFFAELRLQSVDHLGQVRRVYLETSGEMSIYLEEKADTRPGLPIYPELINHPLENIESDGTYACVRCGYAMPWKPASKPKCPGCGHDKWLPVWDKKHHA